MKVRDYNAEQALKDTAIELARKRLKERGYMQPLFLKFESADAYFKAEDEYRARETMEITACMRELQADKVEKEIVQVQTKQTWAERAYA
jgi:hypothetical protein